MRTRNEGGLTLLLLISLQRLLRGRGQRPAGGPGGRDVGSRLQDTERVMASCPPLGPAGQRLHRPHPCRLSCPPITSRLRTISILQMETLRPRKGKKLPEVTQPSGGRTLALFLTLALSPSAPTAGAFPHLGSPRQPAPLRTKEQPLHVPKLLCTCALPGLA